MSFNYRPVERVAQISPDDFHRLYVKPQKPVVIERLTHDWPAYERWHFEYIKAQAGEQIVPLYNNEPVSHTKKVNEPDAKMRLADYIDQLQSGQTQLRIFLYNLIKNVPSLQGDIRFPNLKMKLLKGLPFVFFGGKDVNVFMHYDIDYANILHFHFAGEKRCVIVPPEQTPLMYKVPYANICREDIDFDNPDFARWPALRQLQPLVADLKHGEMLYMPEGYWHYMKYLTPGFSMSLRGLATRPSHMVKAFWNLFVVRHFDNFMRRSKGAAWLAYKDQKAINDTHARLGL
ncbi:MAG: cupin-like domain-containing protein [Formosimonas sp.]